MLLSFIYLFLIYRRPHPPKFFSANHSPPLSFPYQVLHDFVDHLPITSLLAHRFVPHFTFSSALPSHVYLHASNLNLPIDPDLSSSPRHVYFTQNMSHPETMIILDSGATFAITPHLADFLPGSYVSITSTVRGLTSTTPIIGRGTVRWQFRDVHGVPATLETFAHHIPSAEVRLFSPQHFLQCTGGGESRLSKDTSFLTLKDGTTLEIPYYPSNGLPTVHQASRSSCTFTPSSHDVFLSVLDQANQNLSGPQKELLFLHSKYGHINFKTLQFHMREHTFTDNTGKSSLISPVLPTKFKQTKSCELPKCSTCLLAKAKKRPTSGRKEQSLSPNPTNANLEPGELICSDQYESSVKGRKERTYGKEKDCDKYIGGTIFCDVASGLIFTSHQVSLRVGDTLKSKHSFEHMALLIRF